MLLRDSHDKKPLRHEELIHFSYAGGPRALSKEKTIIRACHCRQRVEQEDKLNFVELPALSAAE